MLTTRHLGFLPLSTRSALASRPSSSASCATSCTAAIRATLLEINGAWAIVPVMFPVVVALKPVVYARRAARVIAAILIGGFTIAGGLSIGLFYIPAAIAMLPPAARTTGAPFE
jgi:hypothetical protein